MTIVRRKRVAVQLGAVVAAATLSAGSVVVAPSMAQVAAPAIDPGDTLHDPDVSDDVERIADDVVDGLGDLYEAAYLDEPAALDEKCRRVP